MRCIYFSGDHCYAHPPENALTYKPTEEEKKNNCENGESFRSCPRLMAFVEYIEAVNAARRK